MGGTKALKILNIFTAILIFLAANHFLGIFQALIIKGVLNWILAHLFLPLIIISVTLITSRYREGEIKLSVFK